MNDIHSLCSSLIDQGYVQQATYDVQEREGNFLYMLRIVNNRGSIIRLLYDEHDALHEAVLIIYNVIKSTVVPTEFNHMHVKDKN